MDTQTLTEALRALDTDGYSWKFGLYSLSKSRDGLELEWNLCAMQGIAARAEGLREAVLKKPVEDKPVSPYSPLLSDKENIGALERSDELIKEQIEELLLNIKNGQAYPPEDFMTGVLPKITGYALYGERDDEQGGTRQVLFMRRSNPFIAGTSANLFIGAGDELAACDRPLLKLTSSVDFLMIGDVCYFISAAIEKDFALENRHFAIAAKRLALIAEADIINDYDKLESVVMTSKHARKFTEFDKQILEHIAQLPIVQREEFLSTYGVTIDAEGRMDTADAEQCELIIDLLCCRSCLDALGRLATGSNITPRE